MQLIALDGVPLDVSRSSTTITLPPAGRAEFIVEGPPEGSFSQLVRLPFDTGPGGDPNPAAVLSTVLPTSRAEKPPSVLPAFKRRHEWKWWLLALTAPIWMGS